MDRVRHLTDFRCVRQPGHQLARYPPQHDDSLARPDTHPDGTPASPLVAPAELVQPPRVRRGDGVCHVPRDPVAVLIYRAPFS